ncbi:MAG: hypothetical protein ABSD50_04955 [Smithella sp.]|jgi:hypothetical protein
MSAIKDVVDLAITLSNKIKDRQLAAEILQIQMLILTVQKDDAELVSENLDLKKKIFELENKIFSLKQGHANEISSLQNKIIDKYEFIKELGTYKSKESGHYFCSSCLMKNIESPLTETPGGWRCELKDCGKYYRNPSFHPTTRKLHQFY